MKKIKNSKGFTLMEMLIVVAIIAVLVAIAIPTFTTSLNKARVATDEANIRSGYASVMADVLTTKFEIEEADKPQDGKYVYYLNKDGSATVAAVADNQYTTLGKNTDAALKVAGITVGTWDKGATVAYSYDIASGTVEITLTPKK